jgi:hypothetical protein
LGKVDSTTRYTYYTKMLTESYLSNLSLLQAMIETQTQVSKWQRRFSTENVRQSTRQVSKLASGNSLIVFDIIIKQAKQYDNQIESLNQSMANCNELSLDIFAYTLLRHISDAKDVNPYQDSEVPPWLTNIAQFAAIFFKKYNKVDIEPLFTYLLNKMRLDGEINYMVILREVVASMFGWNMFNVDEMTA